METGIGLKGEQIFNFLPNTFFVGILITLFFFILGFFYKKRAKIVPSFFQNIVEIFLETFFNFSKEIFGSLKKARFIMPLFGALFLYILFCNLVEIMPGNHSVFVNHSPLFRSPSSDLCFTLGLALPSMITIHIIALRKKGIKSYLKKFINFDPKYFFPSLLEIISEIAKIFSLALRLFANLFVGGMLLLFSYKVFPFLLPLPFVGFEIFVSFIQAMIFAFLVIVFLKNLLENHH